LPSSLLCGGSSGRRPLNRRPRDAAITPHVIEYRMARAHLT
jgi:hypothetical protein